MTRRKHQRSTPVWIRVALVTTCLSIVAFGLHLAVIDLQYFKLHKEVKRWSQTRPPSEVRVDYVLDKVRSIDAWYNPNLLWLEAIALEWQSHQHSDNARFYLIQSEHTLRRAIKLRPRDARLWAHLAIVLHKQSKPNTVVDTAKTKAQELGGYDTATQQLLAYFDRLPLHRIGS